MLDFPPYVYDRLLGLAARCGAVSDCRGYPSLLFNMRSERKEISFPELKSILKKKFSSPYFSYGLYVNFPFCRSRCIFCKYYSELLSVPQQIDDYIQTLKKEMKLYEVDFSASDLRNIYFGGGTPSLLSAGQIRVLADALEEFFRYGSRKNETQITVEGTPESIKEKEMREWRNLGVNRVSLGVQSFNEAVLKKTGRSHGSKEVFDAVRIIRETGIECAAIDLIIGLPGETAASYLDTVKKTIKLNPDFIECFLLKLGGRVNMKSLGDGVDLDETADVFKKEFTAHGYYLHFGGNFLGFVKNGLKPMDAVNQNTEGVYSYATPCFGIGAAAQSHFFDSKYAIPSDVLKYQASLFQEIAPRFYGFKLNEDDTKRQFIISQIGYYRFLKKDVYRQLFNSEFEDDFPDEIGVLKKNGVVFEEEDRFVWRLEETGWGHESFFLHAIRYWYHPTRLAELMKLL